MGFDQLRLDHWVSDTRSGYDAMSVVVNRLTKLDHFIPTTTRCSARHTADLLFSTVWDQHSLSLNTYRTEKLDLYRRSEAAVRPMAHGPVYAHSCTLLT